jgi:hypothetical protein
MAQDTRSVAEIVDTVWAKFYPMEIVERGNRQLFEDYQASSAMRNEGCPNQIAPSLLLELPDLCRNKYPSALRGTLARFNESASRLLRFALSGA